MWGLKGLIYERRFRSEVLDVYLKGRPFLIIEILGIADMYVKKKREAGKSLYSKMHNSLWNCVPQELVKKQSHFY